MKDSLRDKFPPPPLPPELVEPGYDYDRALPKFPTPPPLPPDRLVEIGHIMTGRAYPGPEGKFWSQAMPIGVVITLVAAAAFALIWWL